MKKDLHLNTDTSQKDLTDVSLEFLGGHLLFGEIDSETVREASGFIIKSNQLMDPSRDLTLFINSQGGSVYDGFALIDLMAISKQDVKTIGIGNLMSMAVLIFTAGTPGKRIITKNTTIMAHQFSGGVDGKFHEVMASYKADQQLRAQFIHHFKQTTKMSEKQIVDVLFGPSDRYLTPSECKRYGMCDKIVDELPDLLAAPPKPRQKKGRA